MNEWGENEVKGDYEEGNSHASPLAVVRGSQEESEAHQGEQQVHDDERDALNGLQGYQLVVVVGQEAVDDDHDDQD